MIYPVKIKSQVHKRGLVRFNVDYLPGTNVKAPSIEPWDDDRGVQLS